MDAPGHTIDEALVIADQEWRARGILRRDRAALAATSGSNSMPPRTPERPTTARHSRS